VTPLVEVIEFTDPGCPWCWGSEPTLRWLHQRYRDHVSWRRVFGEQMDGPAGADAAEPPEEVRGRWLLMAEHTGAPITARLHRAHASTRVTALAAKAAERHGPEVADATLRGLREAFFVAGRPADAPAPIAAAVDGTPGLDLTRRLDDLDAPAVQAALERDFEEARDPHPYVLELAAPGSHPGVAKLDNERVRYAFPTVIIRGPEGQRVVPGWQPAAVYREAFEAVAPQLREVRDKALDPVQALERYRSLSDLDLELLTGRDEPRRQRCCCRRPRHRSGCTPSGRRVPRSSGPASSRGEASRMRDFYIKQFQSN
jgi:predicted DsbA family dithiol-disulfide isomerase